MLPALALDSFHTAHLDPATGCGLLRCPRPELDVWLDGSSVLDAAWADAVGRLASLGWAPVRDARGMLSYLGITTGQELVVEAESLRGRRAAPDGDTWRRLCAESGLDADPARVRPRR